MTTSTRQPNTSRDAVVRAITGALANLTQRDAASLGEDTKLFVDLGLDSTNALELLMLLEDDLGFEFDPDTLEHRHLETVHSLTAYVLSWGKS